MHHRPAGPPLSVRLSASVRRTWLVLRHRLPRSGSRVAVGLAATLVVTAVLLAVPVTVSVPEVLSLDPSAGSSSSSSSSASSASSSGPSADRSPAESSTSVFPEEPLPTPSAPGTGPVPSAAAPLPAPAEVPSPAPEVTAPSTRPDAPTTSPSPSAAATTSRETPASAPPPAPAAAVTPAVPGVEAEVLSLVNAARADAGCGALVADPGLAAVARAHSADMRDRGFFAHVNLAGQDPFQRASAAGVIARAENIARGQQDAAGVMASWMDSPGHRANILDCGLRSLGVGVATGAGGPWWTQVFG